MDYILNGRKSLEIHGCKTNIHGQIELIQSGSGLVVGYCEITGCNQLSLNNFRKSIDKHKIIDTNNLLYKKTFALTISNSQRYEKPGKYNHPKGVIIWAKM